MKRNIFFLVFALIISLACGTRSFAADAVTNNTTTVAANERMEQIKSRLEEIKSMDKSSLTHEERKNLRYEVKAMRKEAKSVGGGVYLSVGAILIIILVLILIL